MTFAAIVKAAQFAAEKQKNQCRKDVDTSPYINQPLALVSVLAVNGGVDNPGQNCSDRDPMSSENHIYSVWSQLTNASCLLTVHDWLALRKLGAV